MPTVTLNPIKTARKKAGMTEIELAEKISEITHRNVRAKDLSRWENDKHKPGKDIVFAVAHCLKLDLIDFKNAVDNYYAVAKELKEKGERRLRRLYES